MKLIELMKWIRSTVTAKGLLPSKQWLSYVSFQVAQPQMPQVTLIAEREQPKASVGAYEREWHKATLGAYQREQHKASVGTSEYVLGQSRLKHRNRSHFSSRSRLSIVQRYRFKRKLRQNLKKKFKPPKGKKPGRAMGLYTIIMLLMVVILPAVIVKSCGNPLPNDIAQDIIQDTPKDVPKSEQKPGVKYIKLYMNDTNKVVNVPLETYLIGVVAAEMPASYDIEALKAQAIAARTYALSRQENIYKSSTTDSVHFGADVCTSPAHCQAWVSKQTAMKRWGLLSAFKNWTKITEAVKETEGQIIVYNGELINPLYHSNSGGRTEDVENVWGGKSVPYLKGVASPGEDFSKEYQKEFTYTQAQFIDVLKKNGVKLATDSNSRVKISIGAITRTNSGRVEQLKIDSDSVSGNNFRKYFSLPSTNFSIKVENNNVIVTTLGYGHGVGMSQCGAQVLAKKGYTYEQILKYYYLGVSIQKNYTKK